MSDIAMLSTAAGQGGDGSTSWVWVTGKSDQASAGKAIRTLQYDDRLIGGPQTWQALWNRPGNTGSFHDDEGLRITPFARAGQKSNIYVAGRTQNDSGNWDFVALRYSEVDPGGGLKKLIWFPFEDDAAPIYASLANGDDNPAGIAAHRIFTSGLQERIFFGLGGRSFASPSNFDMLTTVYEDSHLADN